ncbi:MAG TPA: hypothetical protein VND19_20335 [Acetobacteraceae bacterium]|nr:hypothetical protein [Acetobacteraceae bacterium]
MRRLCGGRWRRHLHSRADFLRPGAQVAARQGATIRTLDKHLAAGATALGVSGDLV